MPYLKTNLRGWEHALRVAMGFMLAVTGFVGFCPM